MTPADAEVILLAQSVNAGPYPAALWPFVDADARWADYDTKAARYADTAADIAWHRRLVAFLGGAR